MIGKRAITIAPSVTMNPDLVIDSGKAIADVKYKVATADLHRADLYQVVAFAAGFKCDHAAIMGFATDSTAAPRTRLQVGGIAVRQILWRAETDVSPRQAADQFLDDVGQWLDVVSKTTSLAKMSEPSFTNAVFRDRRP